MNEQPFFYRGVTISPVQEVMFSKHGKAYSVKGYRIQGFSTLYYSATEAKKFIDALKNGGWK